MADLQVDYGLIVIVLPASPRILNDLFGLVVVAWLFLLVWRGTDSFQQLNPWLYNLSQALLLCFTGASLLLLLNVLGSGFLGHPEMFIAGNGSSTFSLQWY